MSLRHVNTAMILGIVTVLCSALAGCRTETTTAEASSASPDIDKAPGRSAIATSARGPAKQRDLSFDDLEFGIERDAKFKREMLTPEIEALEGAQIKIYGFILPASVYRQTGIDQFVLVRDNQECCFGPGALIYHNIQVEMVEGRGADFSVRPVGVEGELHIRPWFAPDGKCYSVFHMTANRVE